MFIGGYSREAEENPLHPYQDFAVRWELNRLLVRSQQGAGLFLDPGLGKTRTTLTVIDTLLALREIRRVLLLAPLRPVYSVWPQEIEKWGFPHSYSILHGNLAKGLRKDATIEIMNYEGLSKLQNMQNRWDLIACDESTFCKTWSTKRNKFLHKILPSIPKRSIMTGTPASNSLADLHAQMYIIDNGEALGKSVTYFRNQYMTRGGYMGRQWMLREEKKDEIMGLIRDKVLCMKAEDHLDMPRLVVNDIWCDMPTAVMKQYKKFQRELAIELESGKLWCESQSSAYAKCKQFAGGTVYQTEIDGSRTSLRAHDVKIQALRDLHEELAGKPLLVFYYYTQDLIRLRETFKGAPAIRGKDENGKKMSLQEVNDLIQKWNKGLIPILFCQWQSASHGLNMQKACNDVACFGIVDSLEVYDQAYRRVYRQGVVGNQVRIHRLLTRGTVDVVMLERLNGRFKTHEEFLAALKKHSIA